MAELARLLPHKLQEIPGILQGGIGWQGIVPARAAKMGSIASDKAIAKLGTPAEFYQQLEPDKIAEHIVKLFRGEIPQLVDEVMTANDPQFWRDLPTVGKRAIVARVQAQLPDVVQSITTEIGIHIDREAPRIERPLGRSRVDEGAPALARPGCSIPRRTAP